MLNNNQIETIINTISKYKTKQIGIFGSYARNEETTKSDLDIFVSFNENINLLQLIELENQLSAYLNIKVDLITEHAIHPKIKSYILKDLKMIA